MLRLLSGTYKRKWIVKCVDVNKVATPEQAWKLLMENNIMDSAVYSMMGQMEGKNKKEVVHLCKREIHKMLRLEICNMTYKSKVTKSRML
jgi:hypothetical protein